MISLSNFCKDIFFKYFTYFLRKKEQNNNIVKHTICYRKHPLFILPSFMLMYVC